MRPGGGYVQAAQRWAAAMRRRVCRRAGSVIDRGRAAHPHDRYPVLLLRPRRPVARVPPPAGPGGVPGLPRGGVARPPPPRAIGAPPGAPRRDDPAQGGDRGWPGPGRTGRSGASRPQGASIRSDRDPWCGASFIALRPRRGQISTGEDHPRRAPRRCTYHRTALLANTERYSSSTKAFQLRRCKL